MLLLIPADSSATCTLKTESPPWGCSLVRLKAVACRAKDRGFKSHHPRAALWTNRKVVLVLSQKEAGATPVKAPNEDVAQRSRAPVSEAGSHRYRFAEASYDPCHPRSWKLASLAPKPTNGRLQDWGTLREGKAYNSPRFHQISRSPSGKALVCKTDYSWVRFPPWSPIIAA